MPQQFLHGPQGIFVNMGLSVMPMVRWRGRVLPTAVRFSVNAIPQANWKDADLDLDMTFNISIVENNVLVECEINKWNQHQHLVSVYMRALDLARAVVDVASFRAGMGLTVFLEEIEYPDGKKGLYVPVGQDLSRLVTVFKDSAEQENNFDKVLRLAMTDVSLFRALRDMIDSVTYPHVAPACCGRAIEGIRHILAPNMERKKGWMKMNETLRLERSYVDPIVEHSKGPRHADPARVSGEICTEIVFRSWKIMNRLLEYLKRGSQPLPESEFPTLR